jgi:hypothetical protein
LRIITEKGAGMLFRLGFSLALAWFALTQPPVMRTVEQVVRNVRELARVMERI